MKNIPISLIQPKSIFTFSFPLTKDSLTKSIKNTGLIQPIILSSDLKIVCGNRRMASCLRLNMSKVPAIILNSRFSQLELFNMNIEENLSTRSINIIEKANILYKLKNAFKVTQDIIIEKYLSLLNIPQNNKYLIKYLFLYTLSKPVKCKIIENNISIDTIYKANTWPKKEINSLLSLILKFNLGSNKTSQLIELFTDIIIHKNISYLTQILKKTEWTNIYQDPNLIPFQKGMWLRDYLISLRSPTYTKIRNEIKSVTNKLNLPKNITLLSDKLLSLEDNTITFQIICKKTEDLKETGQKLAKLSDSKELKKLEKLLEA